MTVISDPWRFTNTLGVDWSKVSPPIPRTNLEQNNLESYTIPMTSWRVHDALHTLLPGTSATDDLGLIGGTFGSASPSIQTYDVKTVGATSLYARNADRFILPPEYVAGQTVVIRLHAGMLTTVADTTATADLEVYLSDEEAGAGADLCATAAQSINSLTLADKDFTITASGLSPGDVLDVRLALAINDAAGEVAVLGIVGAVKLLCDTRG